MIETKQKLSLMDQYNGLKARYPDDILLFRLGDFYELFDADARRASPVLEVTLTQRQGVPMCGVPAHAVDPYVAKLLKAGFRVAIADQLEDPATTKGIVKRDVVRVMTAGTLREDSLLSSSRSNFLVAVAQHGGRAGIAAIECSTGAFQATELEPSLPASALWDEIIRLAPSEVLLEVSPENTALKEKLKKQGIAVAQLTSADFAGPMAEERLKKCLGVSSLRGFGLEGKTQALSAAGAAVQYLDHTQCGRPATLQPLRTYSLAETLQLDAATIDHLDLIGATASPSAPRTLLDILDHTLTPMGGRLLRRWLIAPLRKIDAIRERQLFVEFFVDGKPERRGLRETLKGVPDIERILTRLASGGVAPRDLAALGHGLKRISRIKEQLASAYTQATMLGPALERFLTQFPDDAALAAMLEHALVEGPPATFKDGGVIRDGHNSELDELRSWIHDGKTKLLALEKSEREKTGIPTLKVGFNNIFGYYIEVTKTHLARVPEDYIRKQTTANGERYITAELKEFEGRVLGAEERALRLEITLAQALRDKALARAELLREIARVTAELDVYLSLAEAAERRRWIKPVVEDSGTLSIREGRHPVLEAILNAGTLVANDLALNESDSRIVILTGPNMSGKSTYLRQAALIVILAQIGSFVPADEARIGVVDHLFTRIGASDRLADGESTFMVEMVETARILHHATSRSLVILDEVGRGTSTYDGISIAWACLEFLSGTIASLPSSSFPSSSAASSRPSSLFPSSSAASSRGSMLTCESKVNVDPRLTAAEDDGREEAAEEGRRVAKPKVLFATHYFELTRLANELQGVRNAHVTAKEWDDQVIFLHKVEDGPADRAYGIHVARLAGVPQTVVERASVLLKTLENGAAKTSTENPQQPLLFDEPQNDRLLAEALERLEIDHMTPMQALATLGEWKKKFRPDAKKMRGI